MSPISELERERLGSHLTPKVLTCLFSLLLPAMRERLARVWHQS